jgi:hypothetical protein
MATRGKFASRPRIGIDATVMQSREHAMTGSRLVLARIVEPRSIGWTACWIAPWQRTLPRTARSMSERAAREAFEKLAASPPPVAPHLRQDWQREKFYQWESHFLKGSATLDLAQMKRVVRRISKDFNMVAPSIHLSKAKPGSNTLGYYVAESHHVEMHVRSLHYVLHELAHAVDSKVNGNNLADHGPSFVRTMMTIIAHYTFQSQREMDKKAKEIGLFVAPKDAVPAARVKLPGPRAA